MQTESPESKEKDKVDGNEVKEVGKAVSDEEKETNGKAEAAKAQEDKMQTESSESSEKEKADGNAGQETGKAEADGNQIG